MLKVLGGPPRPGGPSSFSTVPFAPTTLSNKLHYPLLRPPARRAKHKRKSSIQTRSAPTRWLGAQSPRLSIAADRGERVKTVLNGARRTLGVAPRKLAAATSEKTISARDIPERMRSL